MTDICLRVRRGAKFFVIEIMGESWETTHIWQWFDTFDEAYQHGKVHYSHIPFYVQYHDEDHLMTNSSDWAIAKLSI